MGIYEGLAYLKRNEAKFEYTIICGSATGGIERVYPPQIVVESEQTLDEKVKTIIHEAIHLDKKHIPFATWSWKARASETEMKVFESEIDALTEEVYEYNPVLVEFLKEKALVHEENLFRGLGEFLYLKRQDIIREGKSRRFDEEKQMKFGFMRK